MRGSSRTQAARPASRAQGQMRKGRERPSCWEGSGGLLEASGRSEERPGCGVARAFKALRLGIDCFAPRGGPPPPPPAVKTRRSGAWRRVRRGRRGWGGQGRTARRAGGRESRDGGSRVGWAWRPAERRAGDAPADVHSVPEASTPHEDSTLARCLQKGRNQMDLKGRGVGSLSPPPPRPAPAPALPTSLWKDPPPRAIPASPRWGLGPCGDWPPSPVRTQRLADETRTVGNRSSGPCFSKGYRLSPNLLLKCCLFREACGLGQNAAFLGSPWRL